MEQAEGQRRRVIVRVAALIVVLFLLLGVAEVLDEDACFSGGRLPRPGITWGRAWEWVPFPHWACRYGDGRSANVYFWNQR